MQHEQANTGLWGVRIPLYLQRMTKKIYNLRLLGDGTLRDSAFSAFLDGYAASIDVDPICYQPRRRQSAEAIWDDFVRIALDANAAIERNVKTIKNG